MARPLMLYDADCGFCTRTAARVSRWGLAVDQASIQDTDLAALGIDSVRAQREMPLVDIDGTVRYGHQAWAAVLGTGPHPLRTLGRLLTAPGVNRLAAWLYLWVSEHRQQLPGGTTACALPPRENTPGS